MATIQPAATAGSGEMCRLTICGPTSRVELAVPAHVPIADLMPTVLGHLDPALATSGLAHGGWVLQRLGEPPLDEDRGTAAAGLFDGDLLHLRPRDDLLPLVDFDDLVDGVHTGLSRRDDRWTAALTRRACVALVAVCSLLAVAVTTFAASGTAVVIAAGGLALGLLAASAASARAFGDSASAVVLGGSAVSAAAVVGLAVPVGGAPPGEWFTGPGALAAGLAVAVSAGAVHGVAAPAAPVFPAVALAGALTAAGAGAAALGGLGGAGSAAIVVTVALLLTKAAPTASARLSGLAVEPVPTSAEEFQRGLDPLPSGDVLDRAGRADSYLTAALVALGAVLTGGLVVVGSTTTWDAAAFSVAVSGVLLLQARELNGTRHRLSALVPGITGLGAPACAWAAVLPPAGWVAVLVGLFLLALAAFAGGRVLPGRRLVPRWGRWGDLAHWVCALAVIPLVLSLTEVYGLIRTAFA
ncbi:type VII secretion integral membrane protein EccD [Saccharothrix yanglingensis]|uniref:Type VII secretion integral membrane protein EccD n=1 Tax=Saccharothrix yanglingensis TaxID=659496 RepID=A0ABU0XEC2_9PSEU|nr:type VII secretion integral membrane protein EccD [Saccharothrix yanglingensis]MDQ2589054.1 type VII secretion integral membrane protein EccD [Saccharothrix yanglingensis]